MLRQGVVERCATLLGSVGAEVLDALDDDAAFEGKRDMEGGDVMGEDAVVEGAADEEELQAQREAAAAQEQSRHGSSRVARASDKDDAADDCPVTAVPRSILEAMPARLRAVGDDKSDLLRVWTTLCCIAWLEREPVSWLAGDGDLYPATERCAAAAQCCVCVSHQRHVTHRDACPHTPPLATLRTIVDSAREWLERYAEERPALAAALADGAVMARARAITGLWRRATEVKVKELRASMALRAMLNRSHVHRITTRLVRALTRKQETCATFLSEPLDGLQRWQMFVILVTLAVSQLLVNIWMCVLAVACCGRAGIH